MASSLNLLMSVLTEFLWSAYSSEMTVSAFRLCLNPWLSLLLLLHVGCGAYLRKNKIISLQTNTKSFPSVSSFLASLPSGPAGPPCEGPECLPSLLPLLPCSCPKQHLLTPPALNCTWLAGGRLPSRALSHALCEVCSLSWLLPSSFLFSLFAFL